MDSKKLAMIVDQISKKSKTRFLDGATEAQISDFEAKNGIKLPSAYKQWLQFSDGGECYLPGGIQFHGVAHKPLIDVNDADRPNDDYIVIGFFSFGDPLLFKKDSEQIAIYNHEGGKIEEEEQFDDFFTFLRKLPEVFGDEEGD